ncbi:hypothetical protein H7J77_12645 [Mycolicibacillus parakoreensis]|uniref:Succinate dehydrogenase membrane anchor subunit n=1 Tax=Mycolicibacillus parakoreensis TaxID=1069221 RepID=A0ABY3U0F6_9MYCO|nr:hypothetical protein [Mycolicibacillus parakoreensis]MCV7316384.1 hypothetical protein [Mycolicibacillus parakoreensis]ULN52624.1 hypothetical protein MIU77_17620 [Mycolicibacillus parakoreensis]HLR98007.1 hypothetical protein [Mycolicibacillus parakoreensis]
MSAPAVNRPATGVFSPSRADIPARTLRTDRWWLQPLMVNLGLAAFIVYATVRAFWGRDYWVADYHYLTPFYSPCVSSKCVEGASHLGVWFGAFPPWIPMGSLVLPILLLFRLTCYYYRKAYYRSVWQSPTGCAVPEPRGAYTGETRFPLIVQNGHRYFFYLASLILLLNTYDAIVAFHSPTGFGFGLGNVILVANVTLLWAYTGGCHSCRHVLGGRLKHFSKHPVRYWLWTKISWFNARHMTFAWITLGTLAFTDFYIWMVASGTISDLRFVG